MSISRSRQDLELTKRPSKAVHYAGWEASLEVLHKALRTERIDGVLGAARLHRTSRMHEPVLQVQR